MARQFGSVLGLLQGALELELERARGCFGDEPLIRDVCRVLLGQLEAAAQELALEDHSGANTDRALAPGICPRQSGVPLRHPLEVLEKGPDIFHRAVDCRHDLELVHVILLPGSNCPDSNSVPGLLAPPYARPGPRPRVRGPLDLWWQHHWVVQAASWLHNSTGRSRGSRPGRSRSSTPDEQGFVAPSMRAA